MLSHAMRDREFAVGISFLEVLSQQPLTPRPETGFVFWVPENLVRLVQAARDSEAHRTFLLRVMRSFVSPSRAGDEASPSRITSQHVATLLDNIDRLFKYGQLQVITDADARVEALLEDEFPRAQFGITLSPEQNFVTRYLGAVFSWSKRTGKAILESGERVVNHVGAAIASLRIPERTTKFRTEKKALFDEALATIGVSANKKWFVVLAIGASTPFIASASLAAAIGVAGFWLALTDP
jgi:hypothetical protein